MTPKVLYLAPIDKAQAANLILALLDVPATPDVREEVMGVPTRLVKTYEQELDEAAVLRDQLSAALGEATSLPGGPGGSAQAGEPDVILARPADLADITARLAAIAARPRTEAAR